MSTLSDNESTGSWRVRIALGLKGSAVDELFHHLRRGEQRAAEYLSINSQGLLPALSLDDGRVLTQSLAICEYLDEIHPQLLAGQPGRFAFGDRPGLADLVLIPQHWQARCFDVDLHWSRLAEIEAACLELDAFKPAVPSAQPDAE